jgi:hypothetical protein
MLLLCYKPHRSIRHRYVDQDITVLYRVTGQQFVHCSGMNMYVTEICGLLGNYTASCGNYLPTFRDNVSVPSSRVKIPSRNLDS